MTETFKRGVPGMKASISICGRPSGAPCSCPVWPATPLLTLLPAIVPQSVKDMPILQDAPPPGGFPSFRIERKLPNTGPTGVAIFGVGVALVAYAWYQVRGWLLPALLRYEALPWPTELPFAVSPTVCPTAILHHEGEQVSVQSPPSRRRPAAARAIPLLSC